MKKTNHIEVQALEALTSIDKIERASPGAYFFIRVQAKMNTFEMNLWEKLGAIISRPVVAVGTIGIILMINAIVIFEQQISTNSFSDQAELVMVDEYNKAVNSFYDYENSEP